MSEKMFKKDEDLREKIDQYFKEKCGVKYDKDGNIESIHPPTMTGLALFLGFADRRSLYDYKKDPMHSLTIKRAVSRMVVFAEEQLFSGKTPTGAIFWLKNHGWSDKQEIEHSTIDENGESKGFNFVDPPKK